MSLTEWAAMGLRAAGRSPGSARRPGGRTMTTYLAHHAGSWRNAFALERGILAVVAIGRNPRNFAGRNLVTALRNRIGGNGVIGAHPERDLLGRDRAARGRRPRAAPPRWR